MSKKLSNQDVKDILQLYALKKMSKPQLAKYYRVAPSTIWGILNGRYWKYVPSKYRETISKQSDQHLDWRPLKSKEVQDIRLDYNFGSTQQALAHKFCVSKATIGSIVRRETYKDII